jgi:opacity protein-like surface antigen
MQIVVTILLAALSSTAIAQPAREKPANTFDVSATFSELRANAPVNSCSCFWMAGGTGEISYPVWRNFSAVAEVAGHTTGNIPGFNAGLSLLSGMGGIRLRVPTHTRFQPYVQALFGGVHGFDSYFPVPAGTPIGVDRAFALSYDTSFAYAVGGGVDVAVSRHIWIRALKADYNYSELRNLQGDRQNQFRIGAGILFRSAGK